jgi:uncharacterized Rossmann fold enzyme
MADGKVLDAMKPQKVSYVIPLWMRDEQVKLAIARTTKRLEPAPELRDEPIAIVGYGPSLRDTWEQVRDFKHIISCSGAHRLLIDHGIIPTWHAAVDPLPKNTVRLIGKPHPSVKYLICSTCHPDVFDHLEGYDVTVWHSFASEEEALRILPRGEFAFTGGVDVGLRSMALARALGFRDLHVFGMDGSSPTPDQGRHAGSHPNPLQAQCVTEYEGRTFYTTPGMLEAARTTEHELRQMPDVTATFYGDGLIQHMAKFFKPIAPGPAPFIWFNRPELISAEMRDMNAQLHRARPDYGVGGGRHAPVILKLIETLKKSSPHGLPSVLDYGCGKGGLARALPFPIFEYDPAIPGKEMSPRPADLVVCTDCLEHVEPDKIILVLDDLKRCVKQLGYFVIHTGPAQKSYANGQNTHLTQRGLDWWRKNLGKFFTIGKINPKGVELEVLVAPKAKAPKAPQPGAPALVQAPPGPGQGNGVPEVKNPAPGPNLPPSQGVPVGIAGLLAKPPVPGGLVE